ncbi:Uncharacterised protein [Vibrio cholerae]|uniref:Uncharacterized protein n=1 Tax=Vibrio cholerae TaxID=666 RepID=A0A655VPG3_VIBCL|nr:Uncharacterised protein [Vibrio cholerae]
MQFGGFDVHDATRPIRGKAARLFNQKCHRVALIEQTQFTIRMALRAWVQVNATFQ